MGERNKKSCQKGKKLLPRKPQHMSFEFNQFQCPENNSVIRALDLLIALIQELDGFIFSQNADV